MKKILFIKKGKFSRINENLIEQIKKHFPNHSLEVFDIVELLKSMPHLIILNMLPFLYEYGLDFVKGDKSRDDFRKVFLCTPFLFRVIKRYVNRKVVAGKYVFTFQTQSLHDCSTTGVPHFIYTDHTALVNEYYPDIQLKKYQKSKNYLKLESKIYQDTSLIFVMGSHVAKSLTEQYGLPSEKVLRVGGGNNAVATKEVSNNNYDQKNILFVGIEWFRKGGPLLVEAFQRLLQRHPDAHLTIVGSSPDIDVPNCEVVGKVPVEKMPYYFNQATVFCMPSIREPFGIVYIEAMLFKIPVIARNVGATTDFIKHGYNGYLVGNDPQEVADALNELLNDPKKCKQFGERGYEIAKKFTWDEVGNQLKEGIFSHIDKRIDISE